MKRSLLRAAQGAAAPHRKNTAAMQTVAMPLPSEIRLPLVQHIGAPAKPVVAVGDAVYVGTRVAEAGGFVSVDIHSGVSGKVKAIEPCLMPNGSMTQAIVITPDNLQNPDPAITPPTVDSKEDFINAVRASGLVGLGGAGFPTHVKLSAKQQLNQLVINAAECEPYITADCRTLMEDGEDVYQGIKLVQKWLGIRHAVIGIERNKPEAIDAMFLRTAKDPTVRIKPLPSVYPQGAEKVLIQKTTGREVPAGGLPADVGVLVLNVTTVAFIARYLRTGMPLTTRRLTVDGDAVANRQNVEVIIGTPIREVLDFCGGISEDTGKLLTGGPMMGTAMADTAFPVLKQNNAILALKESVSHLPKATACIHCGRCVNGCPMGLAPVQISEALEKHDIAQMTKLQTALCIECGTCSFVCPAKRPITQEMRLAKAELRNAAKKSK